MFPNNDRPNSSHPSPSNPPTMQSLALPVEVIKGVIDRCSDHTITLLAFALTCRDLYPRSILVLFTEVRLRNRDRLFDLCDVLKAKPERQPFVQSLSIQWDHFAPYHLLSILPALRHIELWSYDSPIRCHPSTLLCCRRFGCGIRSLTIKWVEFSTCNAFLQFLAAFPGIEHLTCDQLNIYQGGEASPLV
ncbi:hypothetical protein DICSQDRAFT_174075 [Dichomitus squalens LYAD-421 SS1]|uniref:F-box domain-containing protein n=1 Tax=Dichomitus squalens (strain LYAD-421) TaxID=732165 RepID=R7SMF6_DICSQ|nr:uncharacterized protein DICSQDRAFT_174075 [Dichomitus squalens LYAD-421 SS1]EJF57316.1 hypothetical protein DICSQDRAFT_174075 [Dichomitus squalens LYAD-421 SS1]